MGETVKIALTQLILWYDATRIQTWPAFLAEVPQGTVLTSPTDFGRRFATKRMTDDRHAAAEKITRNLPGLEAAKGKLVLRGLGLLEREDRGYRVSPAGTRLAEAYSANKDQGEWVSELARLLITREPRTRVAVWLLVQPGAALTFDGNGWFSGSLQKARIELPGVAPVTPFSAKSNGSSLRAAIAERAWWALGAWREHDLLSGANDCRFVGQLSDEFSLHDIGLALRAAFEVLLHVGALRGNGGQFWADVDVIGRKLGSEFEADFGIERPAPQAESLPKLLNSTIEKLKSDTGYVIASELRDELSRLGVENPDREIAKLEAAGIVRIDAEDYGQRRHGVGLYSDPRKQLIKIRVVSEGVRLGDH